MYVVRRAFRNYGQVMLPGSVVEPGSVKRFKSRLNDYHIVEVTEQDFNKWDAYFKARTGEGIKLPTQVKIETSVKPAAPKAKAAPAVKVSVK